MRQPPVSTSTEATVGVTARELTVAARARVFLGHQSVGNNLLQVIPGVYATHGLPPPPIGAPTELAGTDGGRVAHTVIGANEQPLLKINDFAAQLRCGIGALVEVAMMKLCYIDVRADTDVAVLFATYRDTLAELAREFPDVRFMAVTVPLTTASDAQQRLKATVKALLGRVDQDGSADNVARERLNALIRREYQAGHLFDLAGVESTAPNGARVRGRHRGAEYFALHRGYASDLGHLNQQGARVAAAAMLAAVARAGVR